MTENDVKRSILRKKSHTFPLNST